MGLTTMLVDTMTTGSRRRHVTLFKQGLEEDVELCTTLGREAEESHGRNEGIIETKPGNRATMRSQVFRCPNPHFPQVSLPPTPR